MTMASLETEDGDGSVESISPWVPIGEAATRAIAEVVEAYRAALAYDPVIPKELGHAEPGPGTASTEQNAHI